MVAEPQGLRDAQVQPAEAAFVQQPSHLPGAAPEAELEDAGENTPALPLRLVDGV